MDSKIYYDSEVSGLLITNNFPEKQKQMDLGIYPKGNYQNIDISEIGDYNIVSVCFDQIDNEYFENINIIFSKLKLETLAIYNSIVDLSDTVIECKHLLIGDKTKINLSSQNFKNLDEVTFLSVKTYKGKVLSEFNNVKKLTLWDSVKAFSLSEKFPNIKEMTVNKGGIIELNLRKNKYIERLDIHYCTKLEYVLLPDNHELKWIFVENCKNLDVSTLPASITSVWPVRKEMKNMDSKNTMATGNQSIDSLIYDLKNNMEDYMNSYDPSYTQIEIDTCIYLLTNHVMNVFKAKNKGEAMSLVKSTVLKLNDLNEKSDFSLIETHEREKIAEIIILAGNEMGFNDVDEDVTEEWREW